MIKLAVYWGSWAYFPLAVLCVGAMLRAKPALRARASLALALSSVAAQARFIEPRRLEVRRATTVLSGAGETSPSIKIARFADPHIGMIGNAMPIRRTVQRVKAEGAEAVFLAGDLTYHPDPEDITEDFAALSELGAPPYPVPGNHDIGLPGDGLSDALFFHASGHGRDRRSEPCLRNGDRRQTSDRLRRLRPLAAAPGFRVLVRPACVQTHSSAHAQS